MTASERLRKLDRAMTPGPWRAGDDGDEMYSFAAEMGWDAYGFPLGWADGNAGAAMLRNALPLIADCIEAAEKVPYGFDEDDEEAHRANERLDDALAALREHLEGGDVT